MDNNCAISILNVSKKYNLYNKPQDRFKEVIGFKNRAFHKEFYALEDICFDVKKGETVGIIGTNGSGKSTLLKIITGVLTATDGDVQVQGKVSALLELGAGFNQEYTGLENIYLNGRMMGYSRKEMERRVPAIVEFADIGDFINQPVKTYSSGMFARLAFSVAINVEPDILIVDEALSVGDLFFQNKCFKKFEELKEKKVTILFVSHDITSVRQMCSRVLWIEKGIQKIFDDSDMVCDLYMDMKRKTMNELVEVEEISNSNKITGKYLKQDICIPKLSFKESKINSDDFEIISGFFRDEKEKITTQLIVDQNVSTHVFVKLNRDIDNLIVGFVLENSKGLPVYDINNYINQQEGISGKQGQILEIVYRYKMPRLMKGVYIVSIAIAQGTQERHIMKTWLHATNEIEIVNTGYNSSYIEIPSEIELNYYKSDDVSII